MAPRFPLGELLQRSGLAVGAIAIVANAVDASVDGADLALVLAGWG